jgi:hypothetical protein
VSGLTAAKVLSKYFAVTVLERDYVSSTWTDEAATDAMKVSSVLQQVCPAGTSHADWAQNSTWCDLPCNCLAQQVKG